MFLDDFEQFGHGKRLTEKENAPLAYLFLRGVARAHQDGLRVFEAIDRLDPVVQFETVHIGQAIINDEEMWSMFRHRIERVTGIEVMDGVMDRLLVNNLDKQEPDILVIFDDKNQFGRGEFA